MPQPDIAFWLVAAFSVVFAGISKGGFGSGAAFAAASILSIVIPPGQALGLMLPLLMLVDLVTLRPYWRGWSWPDARLLILGAVPGVALGAALYRVANDDLLRLLIGVISLTFVVWQLARQQGWLALSRRAVPMWGGALAGVTAGFTSFISHAGGPPAAVWLLSRRLDKTRFQATTVLVFWAINIMKFVPYAFLGIFTQQTFLLDLALAPFALVGAWLGVLAHRRVPERVFFAITYVLLSLTGLKLIYEALV
ncbi:MAG: sulfite exporter TauE/SafE family protein [Sediminimonas sp.]|uniref:sulfite exporter TauE/SafE family protein n=1 Tax=Sediminimonas sp. TaxID=2823379 RepID=UPI0028709503|nr:sulfite exporter TauE/SafE family protein [Sediminimonas sp.]MDR9483815.1 sulfite exporter TauE/SafE family protein [Sediminimonas sp.]